MHRIIQPCISHTGWLNLLKSRDGPILALELVSVDFLALYLVSKVSEISGIGPLLLKSRLVSRHKLKYNDSKPHFFEQLKSVGAYKCPLVPPPVIY